VHYLLAQVYRKEGKLPEMKAELESFQKLRMEEAARSSKRPNTGALGGSESPNERPQEEESVDDLK